MKKIIYSLVIMIAAGSLFTSCIEQVEPVGILDLRDAKAAYLKALASVESSKTALIAAQAAAEQALADVRKADAAYTTAMAKYQDALTAALNAQTERETQQFAVELANLKKLYEHEDLMRAIERDKAVAELNALIAKYQDEAAEAAIRLAMLQQEVNYQELLNEAQRIQNMKDTQEMEMAKQAFEQQYGYQAALYALQLARIEAENAEKAQMAQALIAAQELLNKNAELQNSAFAQEIAQAQALFEQQYGYQEAMNALELARIEAENNVAAAEAQARLEDLIDQLGFESAMRVLALARQAVEDQHQADKYEQDIKLLEEEYGKKCAMDAIEIARAQIQMQLDNGALQIMAMDIDQLRKDYEARDIERALYVELMQKEYGYDILDAACDLEELRMQREIDLNKLTADLAESKVALQKALKAIDLSAITLDAREIKLITDARLAYEQAYDAYVDAQIAMLALQYDLEDAKYAKEHPVDYYTYIIEGELGVHFGLYSYTFPPTEESLQGIIDMLNEWILEDEIVAALYKAYADSDEWIPTQDEDIQKWEAELKAWRDSLDRIEYDLNQLDRDVVEYQVNTYHDGVALLAGKILDFMDEHKEPAHVDPEGEEPVAPTEEDAKKAVSERDRDTLKFPVLMLANGNPYSIGKFSDYAYNKLYYMLDEYSDYFSDGFIDQFDDTLKLVNVTGGSMVEWVLGDYDLTESDEIEGVDNAGDKWYGYWGLKGVYAALSRDDVLQKKDAAEIAKLKKEYEDAEKAFKNDKDTLDKGFEAYAKYTKYLQEYKDAVDALNAAEKAAKEKGDAMAAATEAFVEVANNIGGHSNMTVYDSTKLFEAIQNFAAARKAYLEPALKGTATEKANAIKKTDFFYYAKNSSPVEDTSVAWEDLSWDTLRDIEDRGAFGAGSPYEFQAKSIAGTGTGKGGYVNATYTANKVFVAIIAQLVNYNAFGQKFNHEPVKKTTSIEVVFNYPTAAPQAFYGQFKYVAKTSSKPAHFEYLDGTEIPDPDVEKAKTALAKARTNLDQARLGWIKLWNRFWNEAADVDAGKAELTAWMNAYEADTDVKAGKAPKKATNTLYTNFVKAVKAATTDVLSTVRDASKNPVPTDWIKTFTETKPGKLDLVFFFSIDDIAISEALDVVLTSVDPFLNGGSRTGVYKFDANNYSEAQLLYGQGSTANPTEFTKFLYARQVYFAVKDNTAAQDLDLLKAWIEGIEKVAADDDKAFAEANAEAIKEKLAELTAQYEEDHAEWEADKAAREQYVKDSTAWDAAMVEFYGTYVNPDDPTDIDTLYKEGPAWYTSKHIEFWSADQIGNFFWHTNYMNGYVNEAKGIWRPEYIAGTFKDLLDECLSENGLTYPQKLQKWSNQARWTMDQYAHLQTLYSVMNDSYLAAVKVYTYFGQQVDPTATNYEEWYYAYEEAKEEYWYNIESAVAYFIEEINDHNYEIYVHGHMLTMLQQGLDDWTVAVKTAEAEIEKAQVKLENLKIALEVAKKNYEETLNTYVTEPTAE